MDRVATFVGHRLRRCRRLEQQSYPHAAATNFDSFWMDPVVYGSDNGDARWQDSSAGLRNLNLLSQGNRGHAAQASQNFTDCFLIDICRIRHESRHELSGPPNDDDPRIVAVKPLHLAQ